MAEKHGRSKHVSSVRQPKNARNRRKSIGVLNIEWLGKSRDDAPVGNRPASENPFVKLRESR